jgi:hypothetical protein
MKLLKNKPAFGVLLLAASVMNRAWGADATFEYPELSVVPRATERVQMEAQKDREQRWKTHLPILAPALGNLVAGTTLLLNGTRSDTHPTDTSSKVAPWVGMGTGLVWTALILGVVDRQDFYQEGLIEATKIPARTQKDLLMRERLAEESIHRAGKLARKLKWLSAISNLGAGAFMIGAAKENSVASYVSIGAAATAFIPFLFPHRWELTESIHEDYKRRIYAPIAQVTLLREPSGTSFVPGLSLALRF